MLFKIEYKCWQCHVNLYLIYNTEEETLHPDNMFGCPGDGCTSIHDFRVKETDEEEIEKYRYRERWFTH